MAIERRLDKTSHNLHNLDWMIHNKKKLIIISDNYLFIYKIDTYHFLILIIKINIHLCPKLCYFGSLCLNVSQYISKKLFKAHSIYFEPYFTT